MKRNNEVGKIVDGINGPNDLKLSRGFFQTACGRVFAGAEVIDVKLVIVDCPECIASTAFNQAKVLESMLNDVSL